MKTFRAISHPSFQNDGGGACGGLGCHSPWVMLIPVNRQWKGSTRDLKYTSCPQVLVQCHSLFPTLGPGVQNAPFDAWHVAWWAVSQAACLCGG